MPHALSGDVRIHYADQGTATPSCSSPGSG